MPTSANSWRSSLLDAVKLKELIHQRGLSKTDQVLLCLAVDSSVPKAPAQVRSLAITAGVPAAKSWDIAAVLSGSRGKAIRTPVGWELSASGRERVDALLGSAKPHAKIASTVRSAVAKVSNADAHDFVEQAVQCLELGLLRAAVVLAWVGAVAILYDVVIAHHLSAFNAEALRRDARWRTAKNSEDLARMKEYDFLQVLEAISVIGKSVKAELENCLKLRNGCGHPNSLKVGDSRAAAHLETLALNVFAVFA